MSLTVKLTVEEWHSALEALAAGQDIAANLHTAGKTVMAFAETLQTSDTRKRQLIKALRCRMALGISSKIDRGQIKNKDEARQMIQNFTDFMSYNTALEAELGETSFSFSPDNIIDNPVEEGETEDGKSNPD